MVTRQRKKYQNMHCVIVNNQRARNKWVIQLLRFSNNF